MEDKHHSILDLGLGIVLFHPLPRLPLIFITYASGWGEKTVGGQARQSLSCTDAIDYLGIEFSINTPQIPFLSSKWY